MLYSVTGATGLLGNNVIRKLLASGHQVRVGVRKSSNRKPLEDLDVEIVEGELGDTDFARQLVDGADGLIHAAGLIWFGNTKQKISQKINVDASCMLARECARLGVRMILVSSTDALAAGTESEPGNEQSLDPPKGNSAYVVSKRAAETVLLDLINTQHLDVVIVNPCLFFGPWDWRPSSGEMILAITDGFVPFTPSGGISVGDVRNIAAGIVTAMQKGKTGERYILAGENLTYLKLWRKIAGLVGRKGPLAAMNKPMQTVIGAGGDLLAKIIRRETQVNSAALELGACWNYYDSSKAIEELDYDPGDLETALQDAWKWLVENGYSRHKKIKAS